LSTFFRLANLILFILICISGNLSAQINLNQGLVAYYPFNGNANDQSGNNINPTSVTSTLTTDKNGVPGSAMHFNGNQEIIIKDNGKLSLGDFSITYYFQTEVIGTQIAIGKIGYNSGEGATYNTGIYLNQGYNAYFNVVSPDASCNFKVPSTMVFANFSSITIRPGVWYCMVCVFKDGVQTIYINGTMVGKRTQSFNDAKVCSNTDFIIGSWWKDDKNGFKGKLDEIRYYNRALNEKEVESFCVTPQTLCTGNLGSSLFKTDFGKGSSDKLENISQATTSLNFLNVSGNPGSPTPAPGEYTIANNIPANNSWYQGQGDHSGDPNGRMMFINGSQSTGTIFQQKYSGICADKTYEISAWVSNVVNPVLNPGIEPNLNFIVETTSGDLIASHTTGDVFHNINFDWRKYGFTFKSPANINEFVLKIVNIRTGGPEEFGNDFGLDDIELRTCNPELLISSNGLDKIIACPGEKVPISIDKWGGTGNANYVLQHSYDRGNSWINLNNFSGTFDIPTNPANDTILIRGVSKEHAGITNSCAGFSDTVLIQLKSISTPSASFSTQPSCTGDSAQVRFNANGEGTFSIEIGYGTTTLTFNNITSSQTLFLNSYLNQSNPEVKINKVIDNNGNGCAYTEFQPLIFTVKKSPELRFDVIDAICSNIHTKQFIKASEVSGTPGTGIFISEKINTDGSFIPSLVGSGTHPVKYLYTSNEGCIDSLIQPLIILPTPIANAGEDKVACAGFPFQLSATGGDIYSWSPATGLSDPNISNPIVNIQSESTYILTTTNILGCSDKDTINIKITSDNRNFFSLPNAFTPNGDGKNDCFGIQHWGGVEVKEFTIFNRWGEIIFNTKDPGKCWNGMYKGKRSDPGTYIYKIKASSSCGEVDRKGVVNLLW
jgi:gliding motility-associated-like protein